ncbi:3-deoxy-D-manno-octulosonic acid transferase [Caulobacter segnis]|uniref:3-deoxy-D-manno-octulosonic acid transferase n=2 Tax=Caulobacter segnis TaxID=88688 RepID=D5VP51_CAUST|nr:3-deoxy-D-manno-octulosonic acid transferase [Caulobacter segnis]ADG12274.1 Three-deoxy-D-manno-octulosonic-acid transferase domain protein [Caulobacter segnis ATCC 21756]AVQ03872.1 3-deoxy-D-manno-octulosonic acid transferase [Caulobacter segnis]
MTLSLGLYRAATGLLEPIAPALLTRRARQGKEDPARLAERLGRSAHSRPSGPLVWLHGASVGESLSILPLVERLRAERPEVMVLVTSGTTTSAVLLAKRLPAGAIHQYVPVDAPGAARRFIARWKPNLAVFVESELWPNLLLEAKAAGTRLALVSAKLSDRSFARWSKRPEAARQLLSSFDLILAQDARAHDRFEALGAQVAGEADLKFGAAPLPVDEPALAVERARFPRPPLLIASTHPGEDEIALDAVAGLTDRPPVVLAPRHVERGPTIVALARARGLSVALRSQAPGERADVVVADTLGEMGLWFRLAGTAVIAGSLVPDIGGHNPLEAARLDCPAISGLFVENWVSAFAGLEDARGVVMTSPEGLGAALAADLAAPEAARERATRARNYVDARDAEARAGLSRIIELVP